MLWVCGHYDYFYTYRAGIDFERQILTYKVDPRTVMVNHLGDKINNFNFHPFQVVSRYRDPQLEMGENYSYLFNL